jgi:hypothetical protein
MRIVRAAYLKVAPRFNRDLESIDIFRTGMTLRENPSQIDGTDRTINADDTGRILKWIILEVMPLAITVVIQYIGAPSTKAWPSVKFFALIRIR